MTEYRLEVINLHKKFPGVYAVKGANFGVLPGQVHGLVGENGAGKSTLMKMIIGEYHQDSGDILHNGQIISPKTISDSQKIGIAMIHQELAPLPNMTIAENIFLGNEKEKGLFLDEKKMYAETLEILKEFGIPHDPQLKVGKLSVAQIQMLEIIKAMRRDADLIIMDEPTSSLSADETKKLFSLIEDLKSKNVSIIYISHRLEEIFYISDKVTVLRDGEIISTMNTENVTQKELIEMMVGRKIEQIYPKENISLGEEVFSVRNLSSPGQFENISFSVKAGEILGFSGLIGAGRSEIMKAIMGLNPLQSGDRFVEGKIISVKSPEDAINHGLAMVGEDRKLFGLVLSRSVKENISLPSLKKLFPGVLINALDEKEVVENTISMFNIKCSNKEVATFTLSGGNQQKIVIAKWLLTQPKVLILDEPTRGIDVGAKFEIYKIIVELAKKGLAIILISSELPEVMGMSDRILVISNGQITNEYLREDILSGKITQTNILESALIEI